MLPTLEDIKTRIDEILPKYVEWAKREFNLENLNIRIRFNKKHNGRSLAYEDGTISIAVRDITTKQLLGFREYPSYGGDYVIGSFETNDWRLWLDATLAHEVSHVIQFKLGQTKNHPLKSAKNKYYFNGLGEVEYGHGEFFRSIYSRFRRKFINRRVGRQARGNLPSMYDYNDFNLIRVPELEGKTFKLEGKEYKILGMDEINLLKRDRYVICEVGTENYYDIDITTIYNKCKSARRTVDKTPRLLREKIRWSMHDLRIKMRKTC